jgi:hypothetical protein
MMEAKTRVTLLAVVTGILLLSSPYKSHRKVPMVNTVYIDRDMAEVSFVFMVLMACGINETVVLKAARRPISVITFI